MGRTRGKQKMSAAKYDNRRVGVIRVQSTKQTTTALKDNASKGNFVLILVAMVLGVVIGLLFAQDRATPGSTTLQGKVSEVMELMETEYVDPIDDDSLGERMLAAMLSELDPHSSYMTVREAQRMNEQMRGNFDGVGIILHREDDTSFVGTVMADGPSRHAGLLPGDLILTVDSDTVCGPAVSADSVVSRLRGPKGTTAHVGLLRDGKPFSVSIRRGAVNTPSLTYSGMIDSRTGYILLSSFTTTSASEFHAALKQLQREGMERLVIDLRGNGGGSLQAATDIATEFLHRSDLIVYIQGEHSPRQDIKARRDGLMTEGDVAVLIDEFSASASEVLSGALQDHKRATVFGRRSFGKGLVQNEFTLADGSAILLTTARYYTPSGRCIQRPYDDGSDEYYRAFYERVVKESGGDTMQYDGGILPDRVVNYRIDSTLGYYNRLSSKGLIQRTAFSYVRRHVAQMAAAYPTAADFSSRFRIPDSLLEELVAAGEKAGVDRDEKGFRAQRQWIATLLKANIAMSFFGNEGFYRVYLPEDPDVQQVLDLWK